jgi:putative phage-type endonuclease
VSAMRAPERLAVRQGTPEWLALRRTGIGSSDAPVIAGERGSVLELWAQKSGLVEPETPDEDTARLFEWGHRLEPVVADWYADTTGRQLQRVNQMLRHPEVAYAFASLDRRVVGERRLVEIKTTRFGWTGGEEVPGAVLAQVQHQLWVTGYEVADVAVLTGGSEPRVHEIPRDDTFIADLAFLEAEFWGWVMSGTRPPVDGSENARRVLAKLHPRNDGTLLPLTPDVDALVSDWLAAKAAVKQAEATEATHANALRAVIGDADGVEGRVTWKKNADSARVNWPAVAKVYRSVIERLGPIADSVLSTEVGTTALDDVESIYTTTVEGPRVLRPVGRNAA